MKPCTAAVRTLLDDWAPTSNNAICDLYTFTLVSGEVFRFCGWQKALSAPAPETSTPLISFPLGPRVNRKSTKTQIGVEVDILEIDLMVSGEELVANGGAISWQDAIRQGLFDGAYCEVWRCFMSPPGTVVGTVVWFYGRFGDIDIGRTRCNIKVKSLLDLLNVQMPKRLFQSACTFVFGDTQCGFDREVDGAAGPGGGGPAYAQDVTSTAGTVQSQIFVSGLAPSPPVLFDQGTVVGLTGNNTGYKRTIVSVADEVIYLLRSWIFPVVVGDQFTLLPGCDHTLDTCDTVFNNRLRFGGFPYIPPPETAV
jgi:uncharacterized phage protein (TIGR02218 family)